MKILFNIKSGNKTKLPNDIEWKEFKLSEIFDYVSKGDTKNKDTKRNGNYSLVTATFLNNGIEKKDIIGNTLYDSGIIVTDFGYVFYQDKKFYANSHTTILKAKFNLNENIGLFLKVMIEKVLIYNCTFGSNTFGKDKFYETTIILPVKNNEPDWEYMDKFIEERKKAMKIDFTPPHGF